MKYEYMVVYSCHATTNRCKVVTDKEVITYEDVENLDKVVREQEERYNAVVIDFKLLRTMKDDAFVGSNNRGDW